MYGRASKDLAVDEDDHDALDTTTAPVADSDLAYNSWCSDTCLAQALFQIMHKMRLPITKDLFPNSNAKIDVNEDYDNLDKQEDEV